MLRDNTTVRARYLGASLERVFRDKGLLAQDIAERLGWSAARVSRLLHGRGRVTPNDVATILAMCGVSAGPLRSTLLELADDPHSPTWLQEHGDRPPARSPVVAELEESAVRIVCVDGTGVPPLLQSPAYVRAVHEVSPLVPAGEVDRRVAARTERQAVLDRLVRPPVVEAFVGAQVLSRNVFGAAVTAEQARHLLRLSARMRIRMVPEEWPVSCVCWPFQLLRFAEAPPVVHVENVTFSLLSQRPGTLAGFQRIAAWLDDYALTAEESRDLLTSL